MASLALIALLAVPVGIASAGGGQPMPKAMPKPMKAQLFRDPGFAGPSMLVDQTELFMETPWPVRSMRTTGDGKWQICSDSLFDGQCAMIERDTADLRSAFRWGARIESMRAICATD